MDILADHGAILRLSFFLGGLFLFSGAEALTARRVRVLPRGGRWRANALLMVSSSTLIKLVLPLGAAGAALWGERAGTGLLRYCGAGPALSAAVGLVLLDLAIYAQHFFSHRCDLLWKLHSVHHSDRDLDATTALRFHPLEIFLSMLYKIVLVVSLGIDGTTVLAFEILLNLTAMFNHSNLALPEMIENILNKFIVTPQMHLPHHSTQRHWRDSNYGFNLSVWDRIFGTYKSGFPPAAEVGLTEKMEANDQRFLSLLKDPFHSTE